MNQFGGKEQFNCSFGCESANQCEYINDLPPNPVMPGPQNFSDNGNYFYGNTYDDSVVPSNYYENNSQQMQCYSNYPNQNAPAMQPTNEFGQQGATSSAGYSGAGFFTDTAQTYPPCQGPQPWNYAQCYGYYGEAPCQFMDVVDMEDFM